MDGAFNVLLVGADNAPGQSSWGASRQATLNDVNILVHVAADHRSGVVVSLPRDLVIDQPACVDPTTKEIGAAVTQMPLNTSFARGGLSCVVNTVEHLTGVQIPYAALFSFEGTVKMADAVGGVPVCVTSAIDDPKSGLKLPAGRSVISGRTALAYLRSRHGVGDGSDLSRIGSQQAYMSSLMRTMMSSNTFTNPPRLYSLASATAQNVQLSTSMANVETLVHMAVALKDMNLQHLVFVQYPTGQDPYDTAKVVPDTTLAGRLMWRVRSDRPVALDASSLGLSTKLAPTATKKAAASAAPSPSSSSSSSSTSSSGSSSTAKQPTAKKTSSPVIDGLRGQTAAQQTCSIAYGSR
jgi:LCP family protein required for cell wall assembly